MPTSLPALTTAARRQFFEEGICPSNLPQQIAESWLRCRQQGVAEEGFDPLVTADLQQALQATRSVAQQP